VGIDVVEIRVGVIEASNQTLERMPPSPVAFGWRRQYEHHSHERPRGAGRHSLSFAFGSIAPMTVVGYRRLTFLLLLLVAGLLVLSWQLALKCSMYRADERAIWLTVKDFQRSREFATRSEPKVAVQVLDQIAHLPPPRTNRPRDRIIESERARQVHDVIEYLRKTTGEDLGDAPAKWIEKYSKQQ
jgi:hypothetical protein